MERLDTEQARLRAAQETVAAEEKVAQAAENISRCFMGETELRVTTSSEGNQRVRAYIPDEDGYVGWVENAAFTGVARINRDSVEFYVAEWHFPSRSDTPTYLFELNTLSGELMMAYCRSNQPQFDLPVPADAKHKGYFLTLSRDLLHAHRTSDYELDVYRRNKYTFKTQALY